jgi:hypothetical protein
MKTDNVKYKFATLSVIRYPLLTDFNVRVTLTVSLFAFVLFAAFLFENDDFLVADRAARKQSFDFHRFAFAFFNRRHAHGLSRFDRELFAARSDNCVTHYVFCCLLLLQARIFANRKTLIIPNNRRKGQFQTAVIRFGFCFPEIIVE